MEIGSGQTKKIEIFPIGLRLGFYNAATASGLFFLCYFIQGLFSGFRDEGLGIVLVTSPFVFLLFSLTVIPFFQISYLKIKSQGVLLLDQVKIFILDSLFALIFNIIFYILILFFSAEILEKILSNKIL